jgi:hypothetical protein
LDDGHLYKKQKRTHTRKKKEYRKKGKGKKEGMKYRDNHKQYDVQSRTCQACFYISLPSSDTNFKLLMP